MTKAWKTLSGMNGKLHQAEEDACVTKEAIEKAQEEAAQSRDEAASAKQVVVKAREEATRYKDQAIELDKGKRQVETDLAAARGNYAGIKEELLKSEIARRTAEEAEKKAREDLKRELTRSRSHHS